MAQSSEVLVVFGFLSSKVVVQSLDLEGVEALIGVGYQELWTSSAAFLTWNQEIVRDQAFIVLVSYILEC